MNGFLVLLLSSILQVGGGADINPQKIGWDTDPQTQRFSYIIQLGNQELAEFPKGPTGKELSIRIEPAQLVGQIDQIVVKVGNQLLPQNPSLQVLEARSYKQPLVHRLDSTRYLPQLPTPSQQSILPGDGTKQKGWQMDPATNLFSFLVQISPQDFSQFDARNDFVVEIDPSVKRYVEQVIVRVGSNVLPRNSPPPVVVARLEDGGRTDQRFLDSRSYGPRKDIDVVPTNGQSILPPLPNSDRFASQNAGSGANSVLPNETMGSGPSRTSPSLSDALYSDRATNRDLRTVSTPSNPSTMTNPSSYGNQTNYGGTGMSNAPGPAGSYASINVPPARPIDPRSAMLGRMTGSPNLGATYNNNYAPTTTTSYPQLASTQPTAQFGGSIGGLPGTSSGQAPPTYPPNIPPTPPSSRSQMNWALAALVLLGGNCFQFFYMSKVRQKYRQFVLSRRAAQV
jgi:hypothetical protein